MLLLITKYRKMKKVILLSAFLLSVVLSSCDCDEFYSDIMGKATATPSMVSNGDTITLSVGGIISGSGEATIGHKKYYPIVHYLIDGQEVAVSKEHSTPFYATYVVKKLTPGDHIVTVEVNGSRKKAHYENHVGASTLSVKE